MTPISPDKTVIVLIAAHVALMIAVEELAEFVAAQAEDESPRRSHSLIAAEVVLADARAALTDMAAVIRRHPHGGLETP